MIMFMGKNVNKLLLVMKKNILILFLFCFCLNGFMLFGQTPADDANWQLKWEDNFNDTTLSKWYVANLSDHQGEPQLYINDNTSVINGNLVIEINNKDTVFNNVTKHYTSGSIQSRKKYHTKFGYIEGRFQIPYKSGFWPAFWTWRGYTQNYSNEAEIDIFEMLGGKYPSNTITTNIHTCYLSGICDENHYEVLAIPSFDYEDWHTYAVEWDPFKISWYLDNNLIRTIANENLDYSGNSIIDSVQILINVAITRVDNGAYLPPTSPFFQEYMLVDYVKVYQLMCDDTTVVIDIPNYNTFNYGIKQSISLSSVSSLVSGQNITLRASDFIELKNGFEVPLGAELYLDINTCE